MESPPDSIAPLTCLVIGPIGDENAPVGTPENQRWEDALYVLQKVIVPACELFGIKPLRADEISRPGEIPEQVYVAIRDRDLVIADLTDANPNVIYELGLRHAVGKCAILINEWSKLPFDVAWLRTIQFTRNPLGLVEARKKLENHIRSVVESGCDRITATRILQETVGNRSVEGTAPDADVETGELSEREDGELGFLDLVVAMEEAFPRLNSTIVELGVELEQMTTIGQRGSAELDALKATGQVSVGARMPAIARFAAALDTSGDRLESLASRYRTDIANIDKGVSYLLDELEADPSRQGEAPEFAPNIVRLAATASAAFVNLDKLASSLEGLAPSARVLRPPTTRVARSLRDLHEASTPIWQWAERAEAITKAPKHPATE